MQITFDQVEIELAMRLYAKSLGLDFGVNEPKVTLTTVGRGKDTQIVAGLELVRIVAMGSTTLDVLPNKLQANEKLFKEVTEESPSKKNKTVTKKKAAAKKKLPKEEPLEEESPVVSGSDSLFGPGAANIDEKNADEASSKATITKESIFGTDAVAPIVEENTELVEEEEGAVEEAITTDSLFAPKS